MTGISASMRRSTSRGSRPPSILTASAPASLTKRTALATPSAIESDSSRRACRRPGSAAHGAANGAGVVQHLVEGDGKGVSRPMTTMASESPTRIEVDAGFIDQARGRVVVGGQRRDRLAEAFLLLKMGEGEFCRDADPDLSALRKCGMLITSPVRLPPIIQGCRPNNFREYSILGGVASSSSGDDIRNSAARGLRRRRSIACGGSRAIPCTRDAGSGRRARPPP